jgi:nucleoid DNA-binding protein
MNNQKKILMSVAKENNLTISQAEEIFRLFCNKISDEISDVKKTDGLFDTEKFNIIHVDNFGKFVPNQRKIRHANFCLTKNNKQ